MAIVAIGSYLAPPDEQVADFLHSYGSYHQCLGFFLPSFEDKLARFFDQTLSYHTCCSSNLSNDLRFDAWLHDLLDIELR